MLYADKVFGIQADIVAAKQQVENEFDGLWLIAGSSFLIFCLPAIWYFLLDRIREVSSAIAGRDRISPSPESKP